MEWGHRTWGRLIGVAFAGPALYFALRGRLPRQLAPRILAMFSLGGAQGLVGWWMVKSGLEERSDTYTVPRVSPYRLTAHVRAESRRWRWLWLPMRSSHVVVAARQRLCSAAAQPTPNRC